MSTDTERVEEGTETSSSVLETFRDWYHLPLIGVVMLFMFWVRTQAYDRFVTDDGAPALAGVDSWYHWRTIRWTSENYPNTMPYEVWTGFPEGNYVGQFGTLFDQLIVTVAMIVGLGDPSPETLYTVALLMIPAMAALVAIPVFYAGRRLGGTLGGIVSVIILALAKGQFLSRSTVGQLDHHVGEVLFMAIAVVAMMVALSVAEREQPIYELVVDRDWDALRTSTIYSVLAGLALTLYIWVWPSAVLLVGIFGVFFAVQLCLDYARGISPDHVAFVGAVSLGVTAVLTLLLMEQPGSTSPTSLGLLQPIAAFLVAVGCIFMAWFARQWNGRDLDRRYYPVAIGGLIAAALLAMWLLLPSLFDSIVGNATQRMLPIGETATDLTIAEAQPPEDFFESVFNEFGSAFYTMLAGIAFLAIRPLFGRKFRAEHTLVIVWSLFLISMAATQVRFSYYLVLAIAVVNAAFVAEFVRLFNLDLTASLESIRRIETYQVIVLFLVVILLFAPLLPPIAAGGTTSWDQAERTGPSSDAMLWEGSNQWLANNTPEPGNWGEHENADQLEYFGTYQPPADSNYNYPEGAYGVMSWWDYGHLITTQAERIPHANPFQQNARSASAFLTAESEERGELVLDTIAAGENPADKSTEELESLSEDATQEEMRYVMIDYAMAGGKFSPITAWSGPNYAHYVTPQDHEAGEPLNIDDYQNSSGSLPYHDTMLAQLYLDDADGLEQYRLVHENGEAGTATIVTYAQLYNPNAIQGEAAQQLQELGYEAGDIIYYQNGEFAAPGEGRPSISTRQLGFQQIQRIQQNPTQQILSGQRATALKTFERVEGATLTGTVDDEAGVLGNDTAATVEVELETNAGRTFNYTQEAELGDDGGFEVTVPYATTDELGVDDGYTNSAVEATGEYNVTVGEPGETGYEAGTEVPETAVVQGDTITVDGFEQTELEDPNEGDGNGTGGNETDTGSDGGNETGGNETNDSTSDTGSDGAQAEDN
ncbi:oligosaccharyl transferase, archaeosortase A system-associated [Haloterrigena alkaliphila]|uniref:dolichyl-phosphooligosaccharide-protein glycotransferase n=1 Tax=Haloterrigena alkaliphila TaxID=2816475 RepID=A0A8A2VC74_9EURY|nr:oligosaccharyl transferase, archaeosortase A system-associated [Haloterrigena alkaliphila]QSW99649.1 oligosaccharyl transferase, archaeosortase A system-associated [Haloterrigena alkaliphila]